MFNYSLIFDLNLIYKNNSIFPLQFYNTQIIDLNIYNCSNITYFLLSKHDTVLFYYFIDNLTLFNPYSTYNITISFYPLELYSTYTIKSFCEFIKKCIKIFPWTVAATMNFITILQPINFIAFLHGNMLNCKVKLVKGHPKISKTLSTESTNSYCINTLIPIDKKNLIPLHLIIVQYLVNNYSKTAITTNMSW